jgi:hypothetical protein
MLPLALARLRPSVKNAGLLEDCPRPEAPPRTGWLRMMALHDDVTAPLEQWTVIKEPGDPGEPVYNINFPSEKACNDYRDCL